MEAEGKNVRPRGLRLLAALLAIVAVMTASACYVAVRGPYHEVDGAYGEVIYVDEFPPPPRNEVIIGVAPSPSHVWVGGYRTRHGGSWIWVGGRWAVRPHVSAVWVNGRWDRHPRGYVWVGGHWR